MRLKRGSGLIAGAGLLTLSLLAAPTAAGLQASDTGQPASGAPADDGPDTSEFQKVTLNDSPGEPMGLTVLPDSRVLHSTRGGDVWLHDQETGLNTLAAELDVYSHDEEGLQSLAIDPGFDGKHNRWVYLYYSPPLNTPVDDPTTPDSNEGEAPETGTPEDFAPFEGYVRLSRVELDGDQLDMATEQEILRVNQDRGICCHVGGDIVFDSDGNLLLSTGDDTNSFGSGGYTPIDEREDRNPAFDAQRSSGNTNDLRGKVLRITVQDDGSYTVPDGNLFEVGQRGTRPEIYLMGLRNPFRMTIDEHTDELYVGDYSADASSHDPARGPAGHAKWFATTSAGNYGWPYCVTAELPYVDYDFDTGESGAEFDCGKPVNDSPRNTGITELPPVEQPDVWYSGDESAQFPELGTGGQGPMAGPVYHYDESAADGPNAVAWPEHYDGVALFYEYTRHYIKGFTTGEDGVTIEDVLPDMTFDAPMDMEFGPDGALYMLEYGHGYFAENEEAKLTRVDYLGADGNRAPEARVQASATNGEAPLTVRFTSEGTKDPDGHELSYAWDFDADGEVDATAPEATHTFTEDGVYHASLRVTDQVDGGPGKSASAHVTIVVGNSVPEVEFITPEVGDSFAFGDLVRYEVAVTDDQEVDCDLVQVTYILGHDDHGHPLTTAAGCAGSIQTQLDDGHDPETDNLFGVFVAEYTDPGTDELPPLTGSAEVILYPEH